MNASEPCRPMCGCRNRIGRPLPRRTSSMFAPLIVTMSVDLDARLADHFAPARVFGLHQLAQRRQLHRRGLRALLEQELARLRLRERTSDLAMQFRDDLRWGRGRREKRVPDDDVEIR